MLALVAILMLAVCSCTKPCHTYTCTVSQVTTPNGIVKQPYIFYLPFTGTYKQMKQHEIDETWVHTSDAVTVTQVTTCEQNGDQAPN